MEQALNALNKCLESTLEILKGASHDELQNALHDHDKLPNKHLLNIASRSVDLLHETELLLEPGSLTLADYFLGHVNSKCLTAAVELKIPDALKSKSLDIDELAQSCDAHPHRLAQVMRILYNNNIFSYNAQTGKYANNSTSNLLLSDHWAQWRNWVDLYGNEFYDIGRGIPASLKKNEKRIASQVEFNTDEDIFSYMMRQGMVPRFHKALTGAAIAQAPGMLEDYPWQTLAGEKFLDVGGGAGALVALILRKHTDVRAGILDLKEAIEQASNNFHGEGGQFFDLRDRVLPEDLIVGDFLVGVPSFKFYTMRWCLHNWHDEDALTIMANIRRAIIISPESRFVIMEALLSDTRSGRLSRYADITMMMSADALERDEDHWYRLATQTGWVVKKIHQLRNAWVVAIELMPNPSHIGNTYR